LKVLDTDRSDDPEGVLANCAGNLLVRAGDYEKADVFYRKALASAPGNMEYLSNRASCLIELGYYGQADELLAQSHSRAPSPEILDLISYVAVKKGEYPRAESASLEALKMNPAHVPSLFSLGWVYSSTRRWEELRGLLRRLEGMELSPEEKERKQELQQRIEDAVSLRINCASCERSWRVPRNPEASSPIRLYAMPPDEFPAGSCPQCGKTFCIGCAKEYMDESGRFICPDCQKNLKLTNEGLKKIIHDWAAAEIAGGSGSAGAADGSGSAGAGEDKPGGSGSEGTGAGGSTEAGAGSPDGNSPDSPGS
jgi:hypothetical protein